MIKIKNVLVVLLFFSAFGSTAFADQVINENIIIKGYENGLFYPDPNAAPDVKLESWGNLCVGSDCVSGENFGLIGEIPASGWLRLKENNLRLRLHDLTGTLSEYQTWYIEANNSTNGGDSYLSLKTKSLTKALTVLGDGVTSYPWLSEIDPFCSSRGCLTPPNYATCDDPVNWLGTMYYPNCTYVPALGDTILIYDGEAYTNLAVYEEHHLAYFSNNAGNAVAIGYDSEIVADKISLGRSDMLRRLTNVAKGLQATDLLVKAQMDNLQVYPEQQDMLSSLQQQIDTMNTALLSLEQQLDIAENPVIDVVDTDSDDKNFIERSGGSTGVGLLFMVSLLLLFRTIYQPIYLKIK